MKPILLSYPYHSFPSVVMTEEHFQLKEKRKKERGQDSYFMKSPSPELLLRTQHSKMEKKIRSTSSFLQNEAISLSINH